MNPPRFFTPPEDDFLRAHYADWHTADLADALGRSVLSTWRRASRLGLRKHRDLLAAIARGRTSRPDYGGRRHFFERGHEPWNKGVHFFAGGRSALYRFRRMEHPSEHPKWLPIGSLHVTAAGLLERKVSDDRSLAPARRWTGVHRLVWEAAHGPVPAGHIVAFRPGRHTTDVRRITPDALELVTRAQMMLRNSVHRHGPEIAGIAVLRGVLTRAIRDRRRSAQENQA